MISKIVDKLKQYLELQADIVKLSLVERVAIVMSFIMFLALCTVFGLTIFILLGFTLANYIADVIGSLALGYLIVVGVYLVVLILIIGYKKAITRYFTDLFVRIMSETEEGIDNRSENEEEYSK